MRAVVILAVVVVVGFIGWILLGGMETDTASEAAVEEVTGETEAEVQAEESSTLGAALTVEGFDPDRLIAAVEASDLDESQKQAAGSLIRSAQDNPEMVETAVTQLREMLNM